MADRDRLLTLLQGALGQPPETRDRWVDEACGGDRVLRARVADLVRAVHQETERHHTPPDTPEAHAVRIAHGAHGAHDVHDGRDAHETHARAADEARAADQADDGRIREGATPTFTALGAVPDDRGAPLLTPGQHLGRYRILDFLGAGGMGTVYRALDPSLGREVAIKAIGQAFRGDSGSLRRFEREARVLAALSHPNIAAIYGFEWLDGAPYLVLERVEGETLAQRLARGPMSLRETLAVAVQIAEGLEEAHGKGVIHRDLKPSNVMLTPGGRAKLVDFGLAKTTSARPDTEMSAALTAAGVVLGTARYMSPEQVQGEEVDTRADVWAFGCLLYEMLTGRPGFPGRSVPEVLAAVLRDEPDWHLLPDNVPPSMRRLLRRCLRRDLHARVQHIGDARLELIDAEADLSSPSGLATPAGATPAGAVPGAAASGPRRAMGRRIAVGAIVLAAGLGAALGTVLLMRARSSPAAAPRATRLSLELPSHLTLATNYAAPFAIAPAGSPLVFQASEQGTSRLYARGLGDVTVRALPGTEDAWQPFFSPDGAWVAFFANRKLTKVPVGGGPVLTVAEDVGGNPRGATWAADGTIVVAPSQTSGLVRIPERGGRPVALTTLDSTRGEYSHRWPDALPGSAWVLFTVGLEDATFDEGRIEAVSLATGERRVVLAGAGFARYRPTGQLVFVRGGRLYAVAFDPERLAVGGAPEVLVDAVRYNPRNGGCHLAVSASGVLVYGPGVPTSLDYYLAWMDREGRLERAVDTPRLFRDPQVSPDGRQIAIAVGTAAESDLWIVDANATLSQLSFGLSPHRPAWSPDGRRITVGAERDGKWRLVSIAADGTGVPDVLFESPHRVYPNAWAPDTRHLAFQEHRPDTGWNVQVLPIGADGRPSGTPRALAATPFHESSAAISPDGRWIAYESDELDAIVRIYVRSFPDGAHKVHASSSGARWPVWGPAGELYFWDTGDSRLKVVRTRRDGDRLAVAAVEPVWGTGGRVPPPELARTVITVGGARYGAHPSGSRFLVLETAAAAVTPSLSRPVLILDWMEGPQPRRRSLF